MFLSHLVNVAELCCHGTKLLYVHLSQLFPQLLPDGQLLCGMLGLLEVQVLMVSLFKLHHFITQCLRKTNKQTMAFKSIDIPYILRPPQQFKYYGYYVCISEQL